MIKNNKKVRFRFAPSPTGGLHIGTARTALFNWLAARSLDGDFVLRIEDTDLKRSSKEYEKSIINDLKWLGLDWDEFYRQSERLELYRSEAKRLLEKGKAYMCFCSTERLKALKDKLVLEGKPLGYDNKCRNLSKDEIQENLKENKEYVIRYKIDPGEIVFNDLIRGEIKFSSNVISDFVLIKSDGTPSYNFAVVVDDNDMKITHILRGEDHITNTARQILLFKSFGYFIPQFAHLPMILGKDGSKLSKRHGSTSISEFREDGYLAEAIANYLSLLSWAPRDGQEVFFIQDILKKFKINEISRNPAIFDLAKLNWLNGMHIRKKTDAELFGLLKPFLANSSFLEEKDLINQHTEKKVLKCINAFKDSLKTLKDFNGLVEEFFSDNVKEYTPEALDILKIQSSKIVIEKFKLKLINIECLKGNLTNSFKKNDIDELEAKNLINELVAELKDEKIAGKNLYMPIRAALTGKTHGPELPKIISILGIEGCKKRLEQTVKIVGY